jgi:hypothetical protein
MLGRQVVTRPFGPMMSCPPKMFETHARWKKALRGQAVSRRAVITVPSWEVLGKVLSASQDPGLHSGTQAEVDRGAGAQPQARLQERPC